MYKDSGADFLICGGGIVGLTIARELVRQGYKNIIIMEKEDSLGKHASGRNSGVLHAGIYYKPDSLKARSCLNGNYLMKQYCREKGVKILEKGKVIVAKNEEEIITLKELYERASQNGAKVELIDERQLAEIEPYAKTHEIALYSYYTAVVNPLDVINCLYNDLLSSRKVKILFKTEFKGLKCNNVVQTNNDEIIFGTFINASGTYSDRVAHIFGAGINYRLVPFKGIYKKLRRERSNMVNGNIYPVPSLKNPFLGVHFTKSVSGDVYVGPTAIPSLGRENYGLFSGIDVEAIGFCTREAILFLLNQEFREVASSEIKKLFYKNIFADARKLVKDLNVDDLIPSHKVGIRPQLIDWRKKELIMDYMIIKDENSIHILNATSPAFTSSMDFAGFVVNKYLN